MPTRNPRLISVALATLLTFGFLQAPAAAARPATPTGLTPAAGTVEGFAALSWDPVPGATAYDVQVSDENVFTETSPTLRRTVNTTLVLTERLPAGAVWWRVRAVQDGSQAGRWKKASFTQAAVPAPTMTSPATGATVASPVLAWNEVPGATSYTVETSREADFEDAESRTIFTTALTPEFAPHADPVFWRVRAQVPGNGLTAWSLTRSFVVGGPDQVQQLGPGDNSVSATPVTLAWSPTSPSGNYDVQIATDIEFDDIALSTQAQRASLVPTGLPADTYVWRAKPIETPTWAGATIRAFTVVAPDAPTALAPVGDALLDAVPVYRWSGVAAADEYLLEVSQDADFPDESTRSCVVLGLRLTPQDANTCLPLPGINHWRVTAVNSVTGLATASTTSTFTYQLPLVTTLTAAQGAETTEPALTWQPVTGAEKYLLDLMSVDGTGGGGFSNRTINGTSYAPGVPLNGTYRWRVRAVYADGTVGPAPSEEALPTFTVPVEPPEPAPPLGDKPEPLSPDADSTHERFPLLRWTATEGADFYRIATQQDGTVPWIESSVRMAYPVGTITNWSRLGTYRWRITAYDVPEPVCEPPADEGDEEDCEQPDPIAIATGTPRILTITGPANPTGLTTVNLQGDVCTLSLPDECAFTTNPMLAWTPVAQASRYQVHLSSDPTLATGAITFTTVSPQLQLSSLVDSPTGEYFWRVRSCTTGSTSSCTSWNNTVRSFRVTRSTPVLVAPAEGADVAIGTPLTWQVRPASHGYRVQLSSDPTFAGPVTTVEVDGTSYAPDPLPAGRYYWRVASVLSSGVTTAYAEPRSFDVTLGTPTPTSAQPFTGAPVLTWSGVLGASAYDVEIRSGETVVDSETSTSTAYAPTRPLAPSGDLTWRVRARDAGDNPGAWSPSSPLSRLSTDPALLAPGSGVRVAPTGGVFTWQATPSAARYFYERRRAGAATNTERTATRATSYAPTSFKADGLWEWRVVAEDNRGTQIGASPWQAFVVDTQRPRVVRVQPGGSTIKKAANVRLTFSEPIKRPTSSSVFLNRKGRGGGKVAATVTLSPNGLRVTINPRRALVSGATYVVRVTSGVRDQYGLKAVPLTKRLTARR